MVNGDFIFNDKHSLHDMGLITEIVSMPLFAEPKTTYDDLPGTDGELNFSVANPKNRLCFKPRIIELQCHFAEESHNPAMLMERISSLASWLASDVDGSLYFDDDSDFYYTAHAANLFNIERITDFSCTFPLVFKCDPFKYKLPVVLLEEVSAVGTLEVPFSNGGYYCPVTMMVYCSASGGFSVYNTRFPDKILTINHQGTDDVPIIIDTDKMSVTFNRGSILHKCEGDFFELAPGDNTLVFSSPNSNISAEVFFGERYL